MSNYFAQPVPGISASDFCPADTGTYDDAQLTTPFTNGISPSTFTPDPTTGRVPINQLASHVGKLEQLNLIPVRRAVPGTAKTDMDDLVKKDAMFFKNVKNEYCYYEARYKFALRTFLKASTSLDNTQNTVARNMLQISTDLNQRLNNLLEIVAFLTESRMGPISSKKDNINKTNKDINKRLNELNNQQALLTRDNAIVETQKEMVKYTQEKNEHILNQISMFVVLNAAAIGAIFAIWRSSSGS
jgi:hypothetical protein